MKKIKFGIIIAILYFIIVCKVEAAGTVSLTANKTSVNVGDSFSVSINLSGASVATLTTRLNFDATKVEYVSGPSNSNLSGGRVIYTWTDVTGGSAPLTGGVIATFNFKAKAQGNANFSVSGNLFTPEETAVNPSFSGVTVNVKSVETTPPSEGNTGESAGGSTEGTTGGTIGGSTGGNTTGNSGGTTGSNTTGNTNSSITNNNQQKTSNNFLKSLQLNVEGITPVFNKNKIQYYITVSENISNIKVTAQPEDTKANVQVTGNTNIPVGNSQIKVVVTAENGNKKEYIINVTKTSNLELANSNLENLAIENVTLIPEFSADILDYNVQIFEPINKLNILAVAQNEKAKVTIEGNDNLVIGENYIKIIVLAEDGKTSKVYNIVVNKSENQEGNGEIEEENNQNGENVVENNGIVEEIIGNKNQKNNFWWIVGVVCLGAFAIGVVIILIKKRK